MRLEKWMKFDYINIYLFTVVTQKKSKGNVTIQRDKNTRPSAVTVKNDVLKCAFFPCL